MLAVLEGNQWHEQVSVLLTTDGRLPEDAR